MPTSYLPLCHVQLRHSYFATGLLTSLVATPTPATVVRLQQAGLLFRRQPDGFSLLYSTAAAYQPLSKLSRLFPLLFGLTATDAYFTSYSDLPLVLPNPDHTYCLGFPAAGISTAVGAGNLQSLRPLVSELPLPTPHLAGTAQLLQHPPGPPAPVWPVAATATALPLDLRPWGSGAYVLRLLGQNVAFYADDFLYGSRPWGLLEVGAAVLAAVTPPVYTVQFAARPTYWQYQLVSRQAPLPALRITGAPPIKFRAASPLPVAAASYRASQPIALAQRYAQTPYELRTAPTNALLIAALPQASPTSLRPEAVGKTIRYISDIFVQV